MPQPKSSSSRASSARKPAGRKPAARASAAGKGGGAKSSGRASAASKSAGARSAGGKSAASKPAARGSAASKPSARKPAARSSAARTSAASKPAARRSAASKPSARKPAARKPAARRSAATNAAATAPRPATSAAVRDEALRANLAALSQILRRGVVITRDRVQETLGEAVERGHIMPDHAQSVAQSLIASGRQQTQDVLADLEQLLGLGRTTAAGASRVAVDASDRVLREVDKRRRRAGIGTFPILRYDDLTASQISGRLRDLTAAQLRKVRDYESRHEARTSILAAIEKRLK